LPFLNIDTNRGLSYALLGDVYQDPPVILIPGIMATKKNLIGFAKGLLEQNVAKSFLLFDLRNHGESTKHWEPFSVLASASDVAIACELLKIRPKAIIGHSFGGKVAILSAKYLNTITSLWLLDCPPGPVIDNNPIDGDKSLTALQIIDILKKTPWPMDSRRELFKHMKSQGVSDSISAWMTTNLHGELGDLHLNFTPYEVQQMLLDFLSLDLWDEIFSLSERMDVHLIAAERGQRFTKKDQDRINNKTKAKRGFFHVLKDSGHFVHVDNLLGLIEIFAKHL
jgi:esterase